MINIEGIKRIIKKGKMVLIPFSIIGATILSGCSTKQEDRVLKSAKQLNLDISVVDNNLYDYEDNNVYNVNRYSTYSALNNLYNISDKLTIEEFGEYIGETNITWEDIKNTIRESSFDDRVKKVLLKGADNLEVKLPDVNLSALNYNLKNIKVVNDDECNLFSNENFVINGMFEEFDKVVYLSDELYESDSFEAVLLHEVFGHGIQNAYCDEKYCSTSKTIFLSENTNLTYDYMSENMFDVGHSLDEAVAEMISVLASGKKLYERFEEVDTPYDVYIEQLQLYLKTTDTSLTDYINNGLYHLLNKMKDAGCEYPLNYIVDFDMRKEF